MFYFNAYHLPRRLTPGNVTLYLHEGVPGHHFPISLAQENEALAYKIGALKIQELGKRASDSVRSNRSAAQLVAFIPRLPAPLATGYRAFICQQGAAEHP